MARLAMSSDKDVSTRSLDPSYKYFITFLMDSFGTMPDRVVWETLAPLYTRLPLDYCLLSFVIAPAETHGFKTRYDILNRACPIVLITEENTVNAIPANPCAVVELGLLTEPDDVRRMLAGIAASIRRELCKNGSQG